MQWFTRQNSWITLVILLALSGIFALGVSRTSFDYDFEKFFPPHDDETEFFENFRNDFENDYDFLLIGLTNNSGVFDTLFLQKIQEAADTLNTLENVISTQAITTIKMPIAFAGGIAYKPFVHLHNDALLRKDSLRLAQTKELDGSLLSFDYKTTCIFLQTNEQLSKKASDALLLQIETIIGQYDFDKATLAGKIKAQHVYLNRMQREIVMFLAIAIVLVIIFLSITYQQFSNVLVPLTVVLLSVLWQVGAMYFLGKKIDILTMLVPTILFIVGMSDVIHILSKYLEELRMGNKKIPALTKTVKEVGFATLLTSFTTALGFLTLSTSNVQPIREFGIYSALGVMIAYALAITLLPSILVLLPKPKLVKKRKSSNRWTHFLHGQLQWILKNQKLVVIGFFLLIGGIGSGMVFLRVDNKLLEDIGAEDQLAKDFAFFEKQFSGGRPFEMMVTSKKTNQDILAYESIQEIQALQDHAADKFQLGFIQSPITFLKNINRSFNSGLNQYYKLPETKESHDKLIQKLKASGILNTPESGNYFSDDLKRARISGKMDDLGSYTVNRMEADFEKTKPNLSFIDYRLTGSARLIDRNISYLAVNLLKGLAIAIGIVAIAFGLLYKSWRMILIALITNLIPMVCIAGIMGYLGIDIKVSTSIIFTIAFGIAVDDTIHFLSRFKIEQRNGRSTLYAIKRSFVSTGKAMMLTSMILCSGFITMISSGFMSIYYIGLLLSLTLFIALFADLYLLPIMLLALNPKKKN